MTEKITKETFDLEYFFELYPDLVCIAGEDGFLKKINPAVPKLLGYSNEELSSSPIDTFIHPEDQPQNLPHNSADGVMEYENRYLTKEGQVVWLSWTSIFISRDKIIFSIAKDITLKKQAEEKRHINEILNRLSEEQQQRFSAELALLDNGNAALGGDLKWMGINSVISPADRIWLQKFESLVRINVSSASLNIGFLSSEMAMSERQLYRQVNRLVNMTPKKLITLIRLHMVWEAIVSTRQMTIAELSALAGYASPARFKQIFQSIFGIDVSELL
ncbi:PAS domain S-box protein [Pedobacter aquatilis]|uniref:PAS domain S-box protein n=1 Tax=Pedobacter aquatilis TaxID=351343 RepID=UPI002930C651|nr:PAS domain S-box protein [Pedobacter aquatilis]